MVDAKLNGSQEVVTNPRSEIEDIRRAITVAETYGRRRLAYALNSFLIEMTFRERMRQGRDT